MNRDRRKVMGNIFADVAKYTLTAGAIGSILAGNFFTQIGISIGLIFLLFIVFAYFVTPKDKEV
ncbi:MAG: hypothetical protein ABH886_08595 [Candidatus Desantisbacteria bacterium]